MLQLFEAVVSEELAERKAALATSFNMPVGASGRYAFHEDEDFARIKVCPVDAKRRIKETLALHVEDKSDLEALVRDHEKLPGLRIGHPMTEHATITCPPDCLPVMDNTVGQVTYDD